MEQATTNLSGQNGAPRRQMDFVASKPETKPEKSSDVPVPVTSAKAAINAMYAKQKRPAESPTAQAVVSTAIQGAGRNIKSASSLHHGGAVRKNIDTSRTSAAAILTRAESPKPSPKETQPKSSFDPLASRLSSMKPSPKAEEPKQERIPVIRTSLKLGSPAKPKSTPVILPPNSRMARVARPVGGIKRAKTGLIARQSSDIQIIQPNSVNAGQAAKRLAVPAKSLEVKVVKSAPKAPAPARPPRPSGPIRDPQMLGGAHRRPSSSPQPSAAKARTDTLWPATAAAALSPKPKFRPAPKGFASTTPSGVSADTSYVMATPPKLKLSRHPMPDNEPLDYKNVVKSAPSIQSDNTSNYSFSTKNKKTEKAPEKKRPADKKSPFINSVNVEKRPLSDNSAPAGHTKIARPVVEEPKKSSRKNVYAKKKSKSDAHQELPQRPTVIIPNSRRSKVPLFFLILLTIILGAIVGAAAYLCFFQ